MRSTASDQAKEASEPDKSNILLIMTDQQSSDLMSCVMGTQVLHTPHMDSLAEQACGSQEHTHQIRYAYPHAIRYSADAIRIPLESRAIRQRNWILRSAR
jgi:hypothetical protein